LGGPVPDWLPVLMAVMELWTDVATLLNRARDWVLALVADDSFYDPVATALVWSLATWAVAVWAGWMVRRYSRPLRGVAPAGALLATTLSYTGANPYALLPLLGATSLLIALSRHGARERRWEAAGTDFSREIRKDLTAWVTLLSLALMAAAALAPSFSVRNIREFVRQWTVGQTDQAERITTSLGLERQPGEMGIFDDMRAAGLPRRHLVGSGSELSSQVVMIVRIDDPLADLLETAPGTSPPRYYWRSIIYDRYDGRGWYTGGLQMSAYKAGQPVVSTAEWPAHRVVRQEIEVIDDLGRLLHVAGTLVTADQDFSVAWRPPEDTFAVSIEASTYQANSLVSTASEEQLRPAGSNYPEWVQNRYLYLPDWIPDRVLALARDLTATEPTSYDRALALEAYLRTFPYTLDVPLPPPDRDVVDYFLFDLQRGYCDYYATAMVVLARAAGLPARLLVGYFSGTYDELEALYIVTEADAHAWVEVYFPGYGWVEFEPTGGRPPLERPAEPPPIEWPEPEESVGPAAARQSKLARFWWLGILGGLASLALASIVWSVADGYWLRLSPPPAAVATLYRRLRRYGQRLAVPTQDGDTPYEFAASFAKHATDLAQGRCWSVTLAPAVRETRWLVTLYVQASFTPYPPNADDRRKAIHTWRRLRRRLWAAWAWQEVTGSGSRTQKTAA
jgi:transglutaminase-like putative cysteine protease